MHFKDNIVLKKIVILKPKWGTDAVYKVLDNQQIVRNFGKFSQRELATIWGDEQYRNMQDELLQLMTKFKLCYEIPNQPNNYIAPQLLSANPPKYTCNDAENLHFRYQYEFMPKGIITRLIVEMHRFIEEQKNLWKTGVILKEGQTRAEIIEDIYKREMTIRISGQNKREFLIKINHEIDKIHEGYTQLKYKQLIPCNCDSCQRSKTPHFYEYDQLKKRLEKNIQTIQCEESYKDVNVRSLIEGVKANIEEREEERGYKFNFTVNVPGNVIINQGGNMTVEPETNTSKKRVKSSWANGSFYLFMFVVVIGSIGFLAGKLPVLQLLIVVMAGVLFIPLIGVLQLLMDGQLSDESFTEIVKLVIEQLPVVGNIISKILPGNKSDDEE